MLIFIQFQSLSREKPFCHINEYLARTRKPQVSIAQSRKALLPPTSAQLGLDETHYSGTLKMRHFPRNSPWILPSKHQANTCLEKPPLFPGKIPGIFPGTENSFMRSSSRCDMLEVQSLPRHVMVRKGDQHEVFSVYHI